MGYRHITQTEFVYIKDLLKKYKKYSQVAKIAGRSPITIAKIARYDTFKSYVSGKDAEYKRSANKPKTPAKTVGGQMPMFNNDGAILKELTAIRKGLFALNGTIRKIIDFDIEAHNFGINYNYDPEKDPMLKDTHKKKSNTISVGEFFVLLFVSIAIVLIALHFFC